MFLGPRSRPTIAIEATFGGYPCNLRELGPAAATVEQALLLPPGHRAHLSFRAAGEWFHLAADVDRSTLDRQLSMDAGHPLYRMDLQFRNVPSEVSAHLRQLLHLLDLDVSAEPAHTEALQFEIVGL